MENKIDIVLVLQKTIIMIIYCMTYLTKLNEVELFTSLFVLNITYFICIL